MFGVVLFSQLAHMLYIESPAGVGLSYSDDADYTRADDDKVITNRVTYRHRDLAPFVHPYSAGIDIRRQNLTSKVDPSHCKIEIFIKPYTHYTGIQMMQKELNETFMMISNNWFHGLYSKSVLRG